MNINTQIEFGGFYNSIHSDNIDFFIDNEVEYENLNIDKIDYKKTYQNYINDYVNELENYILHEYNIEIDFKNISLDSPKYYNYSTDVIKTNVSFTQILNLNNKLLQLDQFNKYLKDHTKSYDGFMSFYTYDDAKSNKDNILIQYVLRYICDDLNNNLDVEIDIFLND